MPEDSSSALDSPTRNAANETVWTISTRKPRRRFKSAGNEEQAREEPKALSNKQQQRRRFNSADIRDDGKTRNTKQPQRRRFNSAGTESQAKRPTEHSPCQESSWWRRGEVPQQKFVLACGDISPQPTPLKISPSPTKYALVPIPRPSFKKALFPEAAAKPKKEEAVGPAAAKPKERETVRTTSGSLEASCVSLFCRAYGLGGVKREDHGQLLAEAVETFQCSRRSVLELLYGHSYSEKICKLRQQVPNYPPKSTHTAKKNCQQREAEIERIAAVLSVAPTTTPATAAEKGKKTAHAEHGMLERMCVDLFSRAYGLNGVEREDHCTLYKEAVERSSCSRRAFLECLYGHSYCAKLGRLRLQIPNYPEKKSVKKDQKEERLFELERIATEMMFSVIERSPNLSAAAAPFEPVPKLRSAAADFTPITTNHTNR